MTIDQLYQRCHFMQQINMFVLMYSYIFIVNRFICVRWWSSDKKGSIKYNNVMLYMNYILNVTEEVVTYNDD